MNPSPIHHLQPSEAQKLLAEDGKAVYLDVRSQREFESGHVDGAYNIPLLDHDARGDMTPNPDFLRVVQANLPPDTRLIVGCKAGQRSLRAADVLAAAGYTDVSNLVGGMHGQRDMFGQVQQPGWVGSGLPTTQSGPADRTYPHLAAKAK